MMNVESFSLTQKALKEEVNTLISLSLPYGDNRRKERISLEDSLDLNPAPGLCCALVKAVSVVWSRGTCGAAFLLPPLSHRHSLLPLGGCQLTVP